MNRSILKAVTLASEFRNARAVFSGTPRGAYALAVANKAEKRPPIFAKAVDGKTGELYIYETIGFDCFAENGGVTANKVKDALAEMGAVETLNVFINSEGGDVFEAKSIYSQLQRFDAEKVVHIDGLAASAATLVAMAGDRIVSSPVATWMVHEAWSGAMGNAGDLRSYADILDLESQSIADLYAKQTGGTPQEMRELMLAETWMNAQQALEKGFSDEISGDEEDDDEGDGEESSSSRNVARPAFARAAALTQSRIKSVTPASLMAARAQMHRTNSPGQPGKKREPASR